MRVLLLTPPMVQLNTPYPATAYLTGFLRLHAERLGITVAQADPAIELFLRLFSNEGLERVRAVLNRRPAPSPAVASFRQQAARYVATVDDVIRFLQGRRPALAAKILAG